MKERANRNELFWAVGLYLAFCGVVLLSNVICSLEVGTANEALEAVGGFLMLLGAMTIVGLVLPLYLARRGQVELPLLPKEKRHVTVLLGLLVAFLFGRNGYLIDFVQSPRPLGQSAAVFFGPLLVHLASMTMCFGLLLPALRKQRDAVAAVLLTAVAWCVYHALQFYYFPEGLTPVLQFELFSFGLGYALFYLWSSSLLYTFALQHLVAVSTFIYNRDFDFGEVDEPFVMNIVITLLAIAYVFWAERRERYNEARQLEV
jgi:membrane protease YdiL (CAAX protease family)